MILRKDKFIEILYVLKAYFKFISVGKEVIIKIQILVFFDLLLSLKNILK